MSIFEYDEEEHMRQEREESRQEGFEEGEKCGEERGKMQINNLYDKLFELGRSEEVKRAVKDAEYREKLLEKFHLD